MYDLIPQIEDKIKCCINVERDYEYVSDKRYSRRLVVNLNNGHYKHQNNKQVRKDLGVDKFYKSKDLTYVLYVEREDYFLTYDGECLLERAI